MDKIKEFLPFIIPLVAVQLVLLVYSLYHILTHKNYKHGNRILWIIVCIIGMEYIGPILYFIFGREDT